MAAELPEMPNGPILELHGQRKRFHVPHGLKPLLEEMTREILRYQPDDIYAFLAKYVDNKASKKKAAEKRTEKKSWEHSERKYSIDGPSVLNEEELQEFLDEYQIPKEVADKYATKIQAAFRGHVARRSLTEHGVALHKDHRKSWEWKRWSWEGPSALTEEQLEEFLEEYHVSLPVANKYATKIQAAYRGHAVRRSLNEEGETDDQPHPNTMKAPEEPSPEQGSSSDEHSHIWPSKANLKNPKTTAATVGDTDSPGDNHKNKEKGGHVKIISPEESSSGEEAAAAGAGGVEEVDEDADAAFDEEDDNDGGAL